MVNAGKEKWQLDVASDDGEHYPVLDVNEQTIRRALDTCFVMLADTNDDNEPLIIVMGEPDRRLVEIQTSTQFVLSLPEVAPEPTSVVVDEVTFDVPSNEVLTKAQALEAVLQFHWSKTVPDCYQLVAKSYYWVK